MRRLALSPEDFEAQSVRRGVPQHAVPAVHALEQRCPRIHSQARSLPNHSQVRFLLWVGFISRNGSFTDIQMDLINAYVEASDGGEEEENTVWHHDYNQYDEIVYDYQALGKKIVELLSEHSSLQQRKRRSLPPSMQVGLERRREGKSGSFIERLACEIDVNLFVALIEQYAEGDCKIREQPVAR